ncbi:MAG: holo-ACP synthase [Alphaproteobacteria bacterium]
MIIGIGNDLVDIRRIAQVWDRHGVRFETRCFTEHERKKAARRGGTKDGAVSVLAKRFAAKEACAKALGTGFSYGVHMKDIGVIENEDGRPFLELQDGALARLQAITPPEMQSVVHLSLSDDPPYAQAFVVIEALPRKT